MITDDGAYHSPVLARTSDESTRSVDRGSIEHMFEDVNARFDEESERCYPSTTPESTALLERIGVFSRIENRAAAAQLTAIGELFGYRLARCSETGGLLPKVLVAWQLRSPVARRQFNNRTKSVGALRIRDLLQLVHKTRRVRSHSFARWPKPAEELILAAPRTTLYGRHRTRKQIRDEGYDPDDPAVIAALDRVRADLGRGGANGATRFCQPWSCPPPQHRERWSAPI